MYTCSTHKILLVILILQKNKMWYINIEIVSFVYVLYRFFNNMMGVICIKCDKTNINENFVLYIYIIGI